ncbi:hypothetical protein Peur_063725 [Populus x canadensis]
MVTCYSFIKSSCTDTFHILMRSSDAVEEHFGVLGCLLLLLKGLEITNGISLCRWALCRYKIKTHASLSRLMDEYTERRGT